MSLRRYTSDHIKIQNSGNKPEFLLAKSGTIKFGKAYYKGKTESI